MECLAIIPARGGSKGIPGKNLRLLAGKPLVAHSIIQALRSSFIDRVVVSTDDAEIGAVAVQYGAEVIWRPAEISGDSAPSESALLHALEILTVKDAMRHGQGSQGSHNHGAPYRPDLLVFLQCTSPLTLAEDIDGTIQALLDEEADTALAVTSFHYFLWSNSPEVKGINHDKRVRPLRQEREPQYLETGAVYVMRVDGFLTTRHRFFGKTVLYETPAERRLEIDEPVDFEIAELLLRQQSMPKSSSPPPRWGERSRYSVPSVLYQQNFAALVLDFDGVFTDNRVLVYPDGREAVLCDRSDGLGLRLLKQAGLPILVISTEANLVVQARTKKLGLPCIQGVEDKWESLKAWLHDEQIDPRHVIYVGNDVNDLACMEQVGLVVAVADAHPAVLQRAHLVLQHAGGKGAIREICDLILESIAQYGGVYRP